AAQPAASPAAAAGAWDAAKVKEEGKMMSYGMPDDWANWGGIFGAFCKKYGCSHEDTDMSSAEEIAKFDAEKSNAIAEVADIGMTFGPLAVQRGATLAYKNANWDKIPDQYKDKDGNWVGTYYAAVVFEVNTNVVKNPPKTWADLLKDEYKDMVAIPDPRKSGRGVMSVLAAAFANGGDEKNIQPGIDYFTKMRKAGVLKDVNVSAGAIQKGEIPIAFSYDFLSQTQAEKFAADAKIQTIVPTDSTLIAPSAIMLNKYTKRPNTARAFADFLTSDEGQLLFVEQHAHPIRYLAGNLTVPANIKDKLLPDDQYKPAKSVKDWEAAYAQTTKIAELWASQVLGQ